MNHYQSHLMPDGTTFPPVTPDPPPPPGYVDPIEELDAALEKERATTFDDEIPATEQRA